MTDWNALIREAASRKVSAVGDSSIATDLRYRVLRKGLSVFIYHRKGVIFLGPGKPAQIGEWSVDRIYTLERLYSDAVGERDVFEKERDTARAEARAMREKVDALTKAHRKALEEQIIYLDERDALARRLEGVAKVLDRVNGDETHAGPFWLADKLVAIIMDALSACREVTK